MANEKVSTAGIVLAFEAVTVVNLELRTGVADKFLSTRTVEISYAICTVSAVLARVTLTFIYFKLTSGRNEKFSGKIHSTMKYQK